MRLLSRAQACWMLVRGFMNSAGIIFYSFIILLLTLYVFACLGCEVITKNSLNSADVDEIFHAQVELHWGSVPQTMLTLVRFVCADNMAEVYKVLVERDPWLSIYFATLMMVVSLVLFHLLGAVIFSSVMEQHLAEQEAAKRAKEAEWGALIQDLKKMFLRIDVDNSGTLSRDELLNIDPRDNEALTKALGVSTPMQVFNALDVNKTGQVSIAEFVNMMWDVVLRKTPLDLKHMEKRVETMDWRIREMFSLQHDLQLQVGKIVAEVTDVKHCVRLGVHGVSADKSDGPVNSSKPAPGMSGMSCGAQNEERCHSSVARKASKFSSSDSSSSSYGRGQSASKSPTKQGQSQATDELIAKLRQTWEESLVFAFEQAKAPVSMARNPSRSNSPSLGDPARAPQRRKSGLKDTMLPSQAAASDEHPAANAAKPSPLPSRGTGQAPAIGQGRTLPLQLPAAPAPTPTPALPEEAAAAAGEAVTSQPLGRAEAPQPPPAAVRGPSALLLAAPSGPLPLLQTRQGL